MPGWGRFPGPLLGGLGSGAVYKYHIESSHRGYRVDKGDPFAFRWQRPPDTASMVWDLDYTWNDQEWMLKRQAHNALNAPMSIYEVHLGSWMRVPEDGNRWLSYREIADVLGREEDTRRYRALAEKIAAINHWVAQNIRYSGQTMGKGEGFTLHPGAMIFEQRSGVCMMAGVPESRGHDPLVPQRLGVFGTVDLDQHVVRAP